MGVSRSDNSVKIWRNLPISNPKPDLHNINAHTKFGENPLTFTQVIIRKQKTDGHSNILGLGATSMLNFHRGLGATQIRFIG